jgi:hypothetical protein
MNNQPPKSPQWGDLKTTLFIAPLGGMGGEKWDNLKMFIIFLNI